MREGSGTFRLARALIAGAAAAARWLAVLLAAVAVAVPLMRIGANWYVRGSIDLTPPPPAASAGEMGLLAVRDASPHEAAAIREAVAGLRYRIPPTAVSVMVVDDDPQRSGAEAEYLPYFGLIQVQRRVVGNGIARLQWTMAHEIGHYADHRYMTADARERFAALRGIPDDRDWQGTTLRWQDRPEEDFAEVFAALAVPSPLMPLGTSYGPIRNAPALLALLDSVGIAFGTPPPPRGWRDAIEREYQLVVDTLGDPAVLWPAVLLIGAYLLVGAVPAAVSAWRRAGAEGVPHETSRLDRDMARRLNTRRPISHTSRGAHVTRQGRHHGSGG